MDRRNIKRGFVVLMMVVLVFGGGWGLASGIKPHDGNNRECVFVIHGLGRTSNSMMLMNRHLKRAGYRVVPFSYDSRHLSIESAVQKLDLAISNELNSAKPPAKLHFVTHSLGGILTRKVFESKTPEELGRVVMLSPPNQGSELPDKLGNIGLYKTVTGPAGLELGTDKDSYPSQLGAVNFPLGIITGDRSLNPLYSFCIPGKDDGKVSVESARVAGMSDFLVVHASHTWIMNRKTVRRQVVNFLRDGSFEDLQTIE